MQTIYLIKGQYSKYTKNSHKSTLKKKDLTMGKGPEYIFGLQRHTDDQSALEKMLVITNHQRNTKKTTVRYHLTPVRMAIIKKTINNKC